MLLNSAVLAISGFILSIIGGRLPQSAGVNLAGSTVDEEVSLLNSNKERSSEIFKDNFTGYVDLKGNLYHEMRNFGPINKKNMKSVGLGNIYSRDELDGEKKEMNRVDDSKADHGLEIRFKALFIVSKNKFGNEAQRNIQETINKNGGQSAFNRAVTFLLPPRFWGLNIHYSLNQESERFMSSWNEEEGFLHVEKISSYLHPEISRYELKKFKEYLTEKKKLPELVRYSERQWWDEEYEANKIVEKLFQEWKSENYFVVPLFQASHIWESFLNLIEKSNSSCL